MNFAPVAMGRRRDGIGSRLQSGDGTEELTKAGRAQEGGKILQHPWPMVPSSVTRVQGTGQIRRAAHERARQESVHAGKRLGPEEKGTDDGTATGLYVVSKL